MKNTKTWLFAALLGVVSALLLLLSAAHLLRSLGEIAAAAGGLFGLSAENTKMIAQIAGQLKDAAIRLPGLSVTLICLLAAGLAVKIAPKHKKPRHTVLFAALWVLFLGAMFVFTLLFTEVNTISFGLLLRSAAALL